jgi:wobble nucleotide-excising tRNase
MSGLSQFNFVFGANGVGKTTISRVIADVGAHADCIIAWKDNRPLQPLVYNRDFVQKHFHEVAELPGIFTLGAENAEILKAIAAEKESLDKLEKHLASLQGVLEGSDGSGGKRAELVRIEDTIKVACWEQKQKHDSTLKGGFEGVRNSSEKFKARLLTERCKEGSCTLELKEIEQRAAAIFDDSVKAVAELPSPSTAELLNLERDPILAKRVIGRADVDIAEMIQRLGNSDWVKQGRAYFQSNDGVCPFCQQPAPNELEQHLNDYFDESFAKDSERIASLEVSYKFQAETLSEWLKALLEIENQFLNKVSAKVNKELLEAKVAANLATLSKKRGEPSQKLELESVKSVCDALAELVATANTKTQEHNRLVKNIAEERQKLTDQIWRYLIDKELPLSLETYDKEKRHALEAIGVLDAKIAEAKNLIIDKKRRIQELERTTTSIQPTIDGINKVLSNFGFEGFSLQQADNGRCYKLVRSDGSDAKETLSEGERTFVTFLYFYHLLNGSDSEAGIMQDRIVVFDDPVSSLDSDILFIVGCLIKGVFNEIRQGIGQIKQVFVLTHNVYFHKEITYNSKRVRDAMKEESFWVVRKSGASSMLHPHPCNPIKTSYELLWADVRNPDRSNATIQNTLRRILENYFKILGNIDPDGLCELFEGKEKLLCKSLFSWAHDGSHYAHDDLYISIEEPMVEIYLGVFRKIFEKSNHSQHYRMMMGDAYIEESSEEHFVGSGAA